MLSPIQNISFSQADISTSSILPQIQESGRSSIFSLSELPQTRPLYSRLLSHIYIPVEKFFQWLRDMLIFRESEMEIAEQLIEDGLFGLSLFVYDRSRGEEKLQNVIKGCDLLYGKLKLKWSSQMEINRKVRQQLVHIKLGAHALLGNREETEKWKVLRDQLGEFFDASSYDELIETTLGITEPGWRNRVICFSINCFVKSFVWATCQLKRGGSSPSFIHSPAQKEAPVPHVSLLMAKENRVTPTWYSKVMDMVFAYPLAFVYWFMGKISLKNTEMEEAFVLMLDSVYGVVSLLLNKKRGMEELNTIIRSMEQFDKELQKKWFPYSEGNTFVRQKLLKLQLTLASLTGDRTHVEKCQQTLETLGISFPEGPYKEWVDNLLKNTIENKRNNLQFRILNGIAQPLLGKYFYP